MAESLTERQKAFKVAGASYPVRGAMLQRGDSAPDFRLLSTDMSQVTRANSAGSVRLILVAPSVDTSACDLQTRRFQQAVAEFSGRLTVLSVSVDLPFALQRWCMENDCDRIQMLSDHRDMNFGDAYGTHVIGLRQEQRAVFVVAQNELIVFAEYIEDIDAHPNYEAALTAVRQLLDE